MQKTPKDYKYNIEAYYINKISVYSESKNIDKEIETLKKIIEINLGNEEDNMKKSSLKSYTKLAQYYEMELDEKKADENYEKAREIEEYQSFLE